MNNIFPSQRSGLWVSVFLSQDGSSPGDSMDSEEEEGGEEDEEDEEERAGPAKAL